MATVPPIKIKIPDAVRCFACTDAHGVYLSAVAIVFAQTADQARGVLLQALWDEGLNENLSDTFTLKEIPMTGAHVLWNGDY